MRLKILANIGVILLVVSIFAIQVGMAASNIGVISDYKIKDDNKAASNIGVISDYKIKGGNEAVSNSAIISDHKIKDDNGIISGYKIKDDNGNGKLDKNEVGIKGWDIYLVGIVDTGYGYGHDTKIIREHVSTDDKGFYQFDDLPAGNYTITEDHNSKYIPTSPFIIIRNLNSSQNSSDNNFFNKKIIYAQHGSEEYRPHIKRSYGRGSADKTK